MKKVLASLIIMIFSFNSLFIANTFAINNNYTTKEVILLKKELNNSYKGRKYVKIIDKFIEKNRKKRENLEKVYNKTQEIVNRKFLDNKTQNKESFKIIKYIDLKIGLALSKLPKIEPILFEETISKSDKKIIEDKILKLQINTLNSSEDLIKTLVSEFEKYTNYVETGNFEIDANLDLEEFGKFEGNFKINDYISKVSGFDSQFKGEIEALFKAIPKGEDEIKIQIKSILDFISKDGNMYLLLKKFDVIDQKGVEDLKEFIEKAEKIAKENKYIIYSDEQTKEGLRILKSMNPTNLINDSRKVLSKPLIEAYKKEGNKYYLKPTRYACDTMKDLANKFDPFYNNKKCSDSQYKSMLKDLSEAGEFYAEILDSTKTKIGFDGVLFKKIIEENKGYIIFDNSKILEVLYNIDAGDEGGLKIEFENNKKIDVIFKDKDRTDFKFISTLDRNNKFTKIDSTFNENNRYSKSDIQLSLNNRKINGKFEASRLSYDWDTEKSEKKSTFLATISGTTNYKNNLSSINIDYSNLDIKTNKKDLEGNLSYSNKKINIVNKYKSEGSKGDLSLNFSLDNKNSINSGLIKFDYYSKEGKYDYETYEYKYEGDFKKITDINIKIENKNIDGLSKFFKDGKEMLSITHKGNYAEKKFKLDNKIILAENPFKALSGYAYQARNSKVYSDISSIETSIQIQLVNGKKIKDFVGKNNKINFKALNINKNDFKNPDGSDYLIFVEDGLYNIYGTLSDGKGNKIAYISGDYYDDVVCCTTLVIVNGKNIVNGDIVGKDENYKEEKGDIVEININFDFDFSKNKNNLEIFNNILIGDKQIFDIIIKNVGKITFKKVKIDTPKNTIDYKEVFKIKEKVYHKAKDVHYKDDQAVEAAVEITDDENTVDKTYDNILKTDELKQIFKDGTPLLLNNKKIAPEIILIEYGDLECPFCGKMHSDGTIDKILKEYNGKVGFMFKHFPLSFHINAFEKAEAALCVNQIGGDEKYYTFIKEIFQKSKYDIVKLGTEIGINESKLSYCITSNKNKSLIEKQTKEGIDLFGITGTPGNVLINIKTGEWKKLPGAYPYESFKEIIDELLKK